MKTLQIICILTVSFIIAGCPATADLCSESQRGDYCTGVLNGCVCMDEVVVNRSIWRRDSTNNDVLQFKVDERNDNSVAMTLSNYDPAFQEKEVRLVYDSNGDGETTQDEILFIASPDASGFASGSFRMPASTGFAASMQWEIIGGGGIVQSGKMCGSTPNCYIQIGGGGTTCPATITHLWDWEFPQDCHYVNEEGNLDFAFGVSLPVGTVSPGLPVELTVNSVKYLDVPGPSLLDSPLPFTLIMEDDDPGVWMISPDLITFAVPAGGTAPGTYEICLDISTIELGCAVSEVCATFTLKTCNDC